MPKPSLPRDQELRQLFGQLCDQAADVSASFRACGCSKDVRSTGTDGRGAASVGDDLSDEALKRTLARLKSQVSAPNQRKTVPSNEPAENTRTVGTQTESVILESREPAIDETTTTPTTDGRAEITSNIGTPMSLDEERNGSPINTEIPVDLARGPLTLMRLPQQIRALIWWQAMRPEGDFVPIVPWVPLRRGSLISGRLRVPGGQFRRARTALIDRKIRPFDNEHSNASLANARSWERDGEHLPWAGGWALLHINTQIYEEAEAAYWRGVAAGGLMLSFGCDRHTGDYWGVAVARTFFNDFTTPYLQNIQRVHLDLRRPDRDDGPNGGWVPDVRQTPWIDDTDYPDARLQPSEQWVTRLQNITGLTRLRLRVMYAPRDPDTINERLDRDPGVERTIHFMSMLRASMLVNGEALGVGNMRAWANKRYLEFATADRFRVVVQCDDSWDEENKEHHHYVEDDEYDPIGGLNNFGDRFRWDPDADS